MQVMRNATKIITTTHTAFESFESLLEVEMVAVEAVVVVVLVPLLGRRSSVELFCGTGGSGFFVPASC